MKQKIFDILDNLEISYEVFDHEPTFSCEDAKCVDIPGLRVKSLLLKNKKKDKFYMIVLPDSKRLDANYLRAALNEAKLSFVSSELMHELIALEPGHVSPYALINNADKNIKVIFDASLQGQEVGFHPLQNNTTIVTNLDNVEKFLDFLGFEYGYLGI